MERDCVSICNSLYIKQYVEKKICVEGEKAFRCK